MRARAAASPVALPVSSSQSTPLRPPLGSVEDLILVGHHTTLTTTATAGPPSRPAVPPQIPHAPPPTSKYRVPPRTGGRPQQMN